MGFTKQQAEQAIRQHVTVNTAVETLLAGAGKSVLFFCEVNSVVCWASSLVAHFDPVSHISSISSRS